MAGAPVARDGVADGEAAIRHLARHENTSRFITTKLCKYLVRDDPSPELIDRLAAPRTMRPGVISGSRLVAVAAVSNDGSVALAVVHDHRRRGIANELMEVVSARASAIGYPPLHRYTAPSARLAG